MSPSRLKTKRLYSSKTELIHSLLHANALRQLGILEFNRAHWEESKLYFLQAKEVLKDSVGLDSFLCDKWVGIVDYKIHAGSRGTRERLKSLRKEGGEWKHWESVRDIDFRLAVEEKDVRLLTHLYFGTFNERFKERVLEALGMEHLPREYKWKLGKGKGPVVVVDPFEMQSDGFKTGQATFRLLDALTSDFYRPIPIVELFERVFIGSSYSPTTSAARVNQVILRLRKIFKKKRIPLTIQIKDAEARLIAKKPVHLVVRNYGKTLDSVATRLELIREKCSETFTSRDAAKILELSPRGTRVWLQAALNENLIERQRIGRDFQYSIIKPAIKLAA